MCDRSQFNRTRRNLLEVTDLIFTQLAKQFVNNVFIVDSFPLEGCKFGRAHFCKLFRSDGATYGKNSSKKQTYFSFKVHAITTCAGAFTAFEITSANVDDRITLEDLSLVVKASSVIIGDKGYVSEPFAEKLKVQGQTLLALKRNNSRKPYSLTLQQELFKQRRRIETTFSQMTEQLYKVMNRDLCNASTRFHKYKIVDSIGFFF